MIVGVSFFIEKKLFLEFWGRFFGFSPSLKSGLRPEIDLFTPLVIAADSNFWKGVISWIIGQSGRVLGLRFGRIECDVQFLKEMLVLLKVALEELKALEVF